MFKFAVRKMADESVNAVEAANLTLEDIDFLIPHQANIRIIESSAKRLKLEKDKVYVNLTRYGNMSSASVPVAIDEAFREERLKKAIKWFFWIWWWSYLGRFCCRVEYIGGFMNRICEILNVKYPIIQGGMAWVAIQI